MSVPSSGSPPKRSTAPAEEHESPGVLSDATGCHLCTEVQLRRFPKEYSNAYGVESRICHETDDLFVIPSVSPLSSGHVLILPRAHITRLADLPEGLFEQFSHCLQLVMRRLGARFGSSIYLVEHGVQKGRVACGIDHAHLHVIPLSGDIIASVEREVENKFPRDGQGSFRELLAIGASRQDQCYILHGPNAASLEIAFADQIPSQYMRRLIANARCQSDWDWKRLYGRADFLATRDAFAHV